MKKSSIVRQAHFFLCACLLSLSSFGQQSFDTLYDYNYSAEFPYSIYQTIDSGYIFITSAKDSILFTKINKDASLSRQKTFGFQSDNLYVGMSNSLKPTFDGGWVFGGGSEYLSSTSNHADAILCKYKNNGDTDFVKFIGDTTWETAYDCIQTSDSGFVIVGIKGKYSPTFDSDYWIVKTDVNGNVTWERTIGSSLDEQAFRVVENNKNQIVVSGAKEIANPIHFPYIVIYDLQGNLIRTKSFNSGAFNCAAGSINLYNSNEYTMVGCLDTMLNSGDYPYPEYVSRLDSNFNFKWISLFNSPVLKAIYIAKEISDHGIVVIGFKEDNVLGFPVGWITKLDSSGNKVWEHFYTHGPTYNYFSDFQETLDHGFIVCGSTYGPHSQDSWIIKLDSNGCLMNNCGLNTNTQELFYNTVSLNVFPNPATNTISLNYILFEGKEGHLEIYNMLGELETSQILPIGSSQFELNISNWSTGMYLVVLKSGLNEVTKKILKE